MPRYRLTVEYLGTPFVGWQRQRSGLGVQQVLENAVTGFCGERVDVTAAGRTDAGVHALGQVCHLDLARAHPADTVRDALNAHVRPYPIAVIEAREVPDDFHARFSAIERRYLYRLLDRRAAPAVERDRVWWVPKPLDVAAMAEAAGSLVGRHDFSTFRAAECQANGPVKTLDELTVAREGREIHVAARARSFLHHQVRNMVGTLKLVGEGKWSPADVKTALDSRDRTKGGPTAPAEGLYLTGVGYPEDGGAGA